MEINAQKFDVDSLHIATPCSAGWESMTGDERTRHCEACRLNVYNVSQLTTKEVELLIATREGRVCFRMFRRFDGTVVTRDCPVGLRALRKRTALFAGACLSAIVGLFSAGYGQSTENKGSGETEIKIVRVQADQTFLTGTIVDLRGVSVPNAEVVIRGIYDRIVYNVKADDHGYFGLSVPAGIYEIDLKMPGYPLITSEQIELADNERAELSIKLTQDGTITMGDIIQLPTVPRLVFTTPPAPIALEKVRKPK